MESMNGGCTVFKIASIFGKKWTLPLLDEIEKHGDKGFNYLFARLRHITPKILAKRLKELEEQGMVKKNVYTNVAPMKTAYYLTEKGKELHKLSWDFKKWIMKYDKTLPCGTVDCPDCKFYPQNGKHQAKSYFS